MRVLYLAGDNMQILATIERREVTIRQDESDPKGFLLAAGLSINSNRRSRLGVYQAKLAT
jgi:hypothetical protein